MTRSANAQASMESLGKVNSGHPVVCVLLATCNGERFLREQIDSILAQTYSPLTILARDDGSTDATPRILDEYVQRFPGRFAILPFDGASGSAKANFIRLIESGLDQFTLSDNPYTLSFRSEAEESALGSGYTSRKDGLDSPVPYFACADQDDVWLPDKIERSFWAMRELETQSSAGLPLLVFTDLRVVDADLRPLQPSFWSHQNIDPSGIHSFRRLLTQNVVTGCTMFFNRALAERSAPMPKEAFMHDWWLALLAAAYGHAAFVAEPTVLYRQHGNNLVGAIDHKPPTGIPKWRSHEKRRAQWERSEHQAEALLEMHESTLPRRIVRLLRAYVRSEKSPSRIVRTVNLVWHGFFLKGLRPNLAILWYLWDRKAAKSND